MRTAAKVYMVSSAAIGCLAFATLSMGCGGSSGESPSTGGASGSGGSTGRGGSSAGGTTSSTGGSTGAGGSSASGLNCSAAVVPANGIVTDFSDYSSSSGRWGSTTGLYGAIYGYNGANGSTMKGAVDGAPTGLHLTGSVVANDYAGGGLGFSVCASVATFTQVQFDISGPGAPGCDLELQVQTFDQRPTSQTPPGGCAGSCYNFPVVKKVVDVSAPITTPITVTKVLASDVSDWSAANARQVVGIQWQFTGTNIAPDADGGVAACPVDVTITNIKFLP